MAARGCVCQALSCLLLGAYRCTQQLGGKQQKGVMRFLCVCCWQYCKFYFKNLSLGVRPNKAVISMPVFTAVVINAQSQKVQPVGRVVVAS